MEDTDGPERPEAEWVTDIPKLRADIAAGRVYSAEPLLQEALAIARRLEGEIRERASAKPFARRG